jgi:hypothetical protein
MTFNWRYRGQRAPGDLPLHDDPYDDDRGALSRHHGVLGPHLHRLSHLPGPGACSTFQLVLNQKERTFIVVFFNGQQRGRVSQVLNDFTTMGIGHWAVH